MNTTFQVKFWEIKKREASRKRPYAVRWRTGTREHSEWYANRPLAASRLAELTKAARDGEPFDIDSGLPASEAKRRTSLSFLEFTTAYVDLKWPDAAAKTRNSTVDALATAASAFVRDAPGRPEVVDLRRVLMSNLLPPTTRDNELSADDGEVAAWLTRQSRPLYDLTEASAVRSLLDAVAAKLDGKAAAATTYRRKRAVLFNMLSYAVESELLPDNPLNKVKRAAPKIDGEVDPGVVANPDQVRRLLTAFDLCGAAEPRPWITFVRLLRGRLFRGRPAF